MCTTGDVLNNYNLQTKAVLKYCSLNGIRKGSYSICNIRGSIGYFFCAITKTTYCLNVITPNTEFETVGRGRTFGWSVPWPILPAPKYTRKLQMDAIAQIPKGRESISGRR